MTRSHYEAENLKPNHDGLDKRIIETWDQLEDTDKNNDYLKDIIFKEVVALKLMAGFLVELKDVGVAKETVNELEEIFNKVADVNLLANYLAIPYAIKKRIFPKYQKLSAQEIFSDLTKLSQVEIQGAKPKIAFHTSHTDIKKTKDRKGNPDWLVAGTEYSDLGVGKRAYAAESFSGLYKEKPVDYLYVVRVFGDQGLYDASQGWHQATNFPIVDRFDLAEILSIVDEQAEQYEDELELLQAA